MYPSSLLLAEMCSLRWDLKNILDHEMENTCWEWPADKNQTIKLPYHAKSSTWTFMQEINKLLCCVHHCISLHLCYSHLTISSLHDMSLFLAYWYQCSVEKAVIARKWNEHFFFFFCIFCSKIWLEYSCISNLYLSA